MTAARRRSPVGVVVAAIASLVVCTIALPSAAGAARQPSRAFHHYVIDSLKVGSSAGEADGYAFDLNYDAIRDNTLGHLLAGLSAQLHVDEAIAASIAAGDVVILNSLRAHNLRHARNASAQFYLGRRSGRGTFAVDPSAAPGGELYGSIKHSQFNGGLAEIPLRLGLSAGQDPVELHLLEARMQADCTATGCTHGKINGGIAATEVNAVIVSAIAHALQAIVDSSCVPGHPGSCSAQAEQLLNLFDADGDGVITADELRSNTLIQAVLQPDLDLLKADGTPGRDGVKESLSLGLGFTSVRARFAIAHERYPRPRDFPPRPVAFRAYMTEDVSPLGSIEGAGHATGLGSVSDHANCAALPGCTSPSTGSYPPCEVGVFLDFGEFPPLIGVYAQLAMDDHHGDRLCLAYAVRLTDTDSPARGEHFALTGEFAINGGTGEFRDAVGTGTVTGSCTSPPTNPDAICVEDWRGSITK